MKAIHWTPKENKSSILEHGIKVKDTWVSGSILTPFHNLNRWWLDFLLNDGEYVGCVFELAPSDFPLVHSHWVIDTHVEYDDDHEEESRRRFTYNEILRDNPASVFQSIEDLKHDYKQSILWRIGDAIAENCDAYKAKNNKEEDRKRIAAAAKFITQNRKKAFEKYFDNPGFMEFVFEDYELLFFKDIRPERIEKVILSSTSYPYSDLMDEIKQSV